MTRNEMIYMVQCLLYDVRLDWAHNVEQRVELARHYCLELNDDFNTLADRCVNYLNTVEKEGNFDGRYFREDFPLGYENMNKLHSLSNKLADKSEEFIRIARENLRCIEFMFEDC